MPIWKILTSAEYSFVTDGTNSVDLYLLAMSLGLRINETPKLIALTDNFQYSTVAKKCDVEMLSRIYGIEPDKSVSTLGRYAGVGINYIYRYHFDLETNILDINGILQSFSNSEIVQCNSCGKFSNPDCKNCTCEIPVE